MYNSNSNKEQDPALHQHQRHVHPPSGGPSEADPLLPGHPPLYYGVPQPASAHILPVPVLVERRVRVFYSSLSSTYATMFVLFAICYAMALFTLFVNDFIRISKDPLFGSEIRFGLFETCLTRSVNGNDIFSCHSWPNSDCKLFGNDGNQVIGGDDQRQPRLSFCQGFLAARYLEIGAQIFGGLAIIAWALMISEPIRRVATAPSLWLTIIFVSLQIIVMKIMIDLKGDDSAFFVSRSFGNSFVTLLGSWILAILLLLILAVTVMIRHSNYRYVYHAGA
ncbi:hypothetical protein SeMB42_g02320 [Synchytrium endobioticum]|uniref:Uncharacterized protein n=1 Tax=Synchytrium endobioticum TaxID=286115 RepID=A0A507DEV4_9FUNG|nr:hypothetical protein SeLEV6574_g03113 [Synchytrium endobioticum]TPX50229.1 hypothetical protein SeMB42_g02320 [Synchytrium endobioticum]